MSSVYKDSLNLPQTAFPMKADLPNREKEILAKWEADGTYARLRERSKGKPRFVLHDGPPFANGEIHLGHVLNKTLKDFVIRYKTLRGHDAPYVPGWDCHGLPIEHQVMKNLKSDDKTPVRIRKECAAYAEKFIGIQREQFKRLGVWGDWADPYVTMRPAYEADILRNFADLVKQGHVYEGLKPVFWSTGCRTALAEAEIEYENRNDTAIFVRFPLKEGGEGAALAADARRRAGLPADAPASLVVWTTTPWTLPANLAVAVNPDFEYIFVSDDKEVLLVAAPRIAELERVAGKSYKHLQHLKGLQLENGMVKYRHPFLDREGRILSAGFVTSDSGSGLVHIAPGHGQDDYQLGQKAGLKLLSPVDDAGRLTSEAGLTGENGLPNLTGTYVFDANPLIVKLLEDKGALIKAESYSHSYPHCWRSKTPIIFRSVKQWFIQVEAFKGQALKLIQDVTWIPGWGKNRIEGSVSSRADWCISRQRTWGVPIPAFYDASGKAFLDAATISKFADIVEKEGTDVWFSHSDEQMAERLGLGKLVDLKKGTDTLDVWIDSGSSWRAVSARRLGASADKPVDLYLEGSDQHRGWFQSSLLLSCAVQKKAPFKSVLTHGFVVDGQGKKMSKSVGNVVVPEEVMKRLGADILRLWVSSSDYSEDIRVSQDIFDRIADSYRKIRNTVRFMLGNLHHFDPAKDTLPDQELLETDRWALLKLASLVKEASEAYEANEFHRFYQAVHQFCVKDLSAVYFDMLKDRLYADPASSRSGRSCRTALYEITHTLIRILSPILAFTAEEAWGSLTHKPDGETSVHLTAWPDKTGRWHDPALEAKWDALLVWRGRILKALEEKRELKEIGNSLEAEVELHASQEAERKYLGEHRELLSQITLVSGLSVVSCNEGFSILVSRARGLKCARCWIWREEVGRSSEHPDLCSRCEGAVKGHKS
jgi:isoleucyl-tRNA synthetase